MFAQLSHWNVSFILISVIALAAQSALAQKYREVYDLENINTIVWGVPDYVYDNIAKTNPSINLETSKSKEIVVNLAALEAMYNKSIESGHEMTYTSISGEVRNVTSFAEYKDQYVRELLHGNNFNDDNKDEEKSDGMCAGKVFSKVSRWIFGLVGF